MEWMEGLKRAQVEVLEELVEWVGMAWGYDGASRVGSRREIKL